MKSQLIKDTGPEKGEEILTQTFRSYDGNDIELNFASNGATLICLSLYCSHCVDLLPQISVIREQSGLEVYLFIDGDKEDLVELSEYFQWDFSLILLSTDQMFSCFQVSHHPFVIVVDGYGIVKSKGIIYNAEDFIKLTQMTEVV
ncbi:thioredoxin domain-containing protein [Paenibacillus alba]|uniref:Alkyl hydroperoxide reductase n=1 Tax=Paenibacillus alba TaxID=1197127 RepID=A0ABU6GD71_9BACL|nr:alkyl hydroperoxide reductase [Paenibacillus alba]MEC0231595.1 alkyl hydroperoxide reductase [Paenibacillus alba]